MWPEMVYEDGVLVLVLWVGWRSLWHLASHPALKFNTVFPSGGQAGSTVEVTITGENLDEIESLRLGIPGAVCKFQQSDTHRFQLSIPAETPVGVYDIHVVGKNGLSSPRAFTVGTLLEKLELEPNDSWTAAQASDLNSVLNGRIEKGGDQDCIEFVARRGATCCDRMFSPNGLDHRYVQCWSCLMRNRTGLLVTEDILALIQ